MIASLPMYDWRELETATDLLWQHLRCALEMEGFVAPFVLEREGQQLEHWLSPDLLLSQTCGYPYATQLVGKAELVATPHYDVPGCDGPNYTSAVLIHVDCDATSIEEMRGTRFVFNGEDSLSGFRCLGPVMGDPHVFFASCNVSGAHRNSAKMVAEGAADVCACDALCWAYFQKFVPEAAKNLKVLTWTPSLPSLPLITNRNWSGDEFTKLRRAVLMGINDAGADLACAELCLKGASIVGMRDYMSLLDTIDYTS